MPGAEVTIRRLDACDERALADFAAAIPHSDRNFFKEDVADPATIHRWLENRGDLRMIAVGERQQILALAILRRGLARASHVAELRLVVAADRRGRGVGRALTQRMMIEAFSLGVHKILVEITAGDRAAFALFSALGFTPEAVLRDHLRDSNGTLHDVLLFVHIVGDNWGELSAMGVEEELG